MLAAALFLDQHGVAVGREAGGEGLEQHLDAERPQPLGHGPRQLDVVGRQDALLGLDDRHLGAELGEGRAELQADIARADHHQPLRHHRQSERLGRGNHLAAERQGGERRWHRAGRQHDMLGADHLRAGVGVDLAGLAVDHLGMALHDLDVVALQQGADAAGQAADDAVLPFDRAGEIDGGMLDPQAEGGRGRLLDGMMIGLGGMDDRLRGNAADIEAACRYSH